MKTPFEKVLENIYRLNDELPILNDFIHGGEHLDINTDFGTISSLRKIIKDIEEKFNELTDKNIAEEVQNRYGGELEILERNAIESEDNTRIIKEHGTHVEKLRDDIQSSADKIEGIYNWSLEFLEETSQIEAFIQNAQDVLLPEMENAAIKSKDSLKQSANLKTSIISGSADLVKQGKEVGKIFVDFQNLLNQCDEIIKTLDQHEYDISTWLSDIETTEKDVKKHVSNSHKYQAEALGYRNNASANVASINNKLDEIRRFSVASGGSLYVDTTAIYVNSLNDHHVRNVVYKTYPQAWFKSGDLLTVKWSYSITRYNADHTPYYILQDYMSQYVKLNANEWHSLFRNIHGRTRTVGKTPDPYHH